MKDLEKQYRVREKGIRVFLDRRLPKGEEGEDYLQEVFLQGLETAADGTILEDAAAWLFAVARRRIADAWRRRGRVSETDLEELAEILVSTELGPEEAFEAEEAAAAIRTALEILPPEQREVLTLHVVEGLTFREIAEIQGVPLNTAMTRKRYAVKSLRKEILTLKLITEDE